MVSFLNGTKSEETMITALCGKARGCVEVRHEEWRSRTFEKTSSTVRRSYLTKGSYKVGWVMDNDIRECMECTKTFTWFRRRHHCRMCGVLVCNECSSQRMHVKHFPELESRVCTTCHVGYKAPEMRRVSFDLSDRPSMQVLRERNSPGAGGIGASTGRDRSTSAESALVMRKSPLKTMEVGEKEGEEEDEYEREVDSAAFHSTCHDDYLIMRSLVPIDIWDTTVGSLKNRGIPLPLVKRLWDRRALWLLVMHPEDITKLHVADLRGKYSHNRLDLVEMRAMWYALTTAKKNTTGFENADKKDWFRIFRRSLMDYELRSEAGTLLPEERRHSAYSGLEGSSFSNSEATIEKRISMSSVSSVSEKVEHFNSLKGRISEAEAASSTTEARIEVASLKQDGLVAKGSIALEIKNHIPFSDSLPRSKGPNNAEEFLCTLQNKQRKAHKGRLVTPAKEQLTKIVETTPVLSTSVNTNMSVNMNMRMDVSVTDPIPIIMSSPDPWGWESNASSSQNTPVPECGEEPLPLYEPLAKAPHSAVTDELLLSPIASSEEECISVTKLPRTVTKTPRGMIRDSLKEHSFFYSDDESDVGESPRVNDTPRNETVGDMFPPSTVDVFGTPDFTSPVFTSPDFSFSQKKSEGRRDSLQNFDSPLEDSPLPVDGRKSLADLVLHQAAVPGHDTTMAITEEMDLEAVKDHVERNDSEKSEDANMSPSALAKTKPVQASIQAFSTPVTCSALRAVNSGVGFSWGKYSGSRIPNSIFQPTAMGSLSSMKFKGTTDKENAAVENTPNPITTTTSSSSESSKSSSNFNGPAKRIVSLKAQKDSCETMKQLLLEGMAAAAKDFAKIQANEWDLLEGVTPISDASEASFVKRHAAAVGLCPKTATDVLLQCVDDPESLKEPLETLIVLVDTLGADVNAADASHDGRTVLAAVFNMPLMGRILLMRGADPLMCDNHGSDSALQLCLEYDCDWMLSAMDACNLADSLKTDRLKEYCRQFIMGGYGARVQTYSQKAGFTPDEATELMVSCKDRFQDMTDPMGTFEALEELGARE